MTLFGYRFGIRFFTFLGLLTLLVFIFGLDPEGLSPWGIVLFFTCVWVVLSGVFSLLLLFVYERMIGEAGATHFIGGALRQGILLGSYGLSLTILLYFHVLAWWNALLLLAFILLLEFTYRRLSPTD